MKERNIFNISFNDRSVYPIRKYKYKFNVHGFDTETYKGYVTLLGVYGDKKRTYCIPDNVEDVLKFLMNREFYKSHNFFFNVKYDCDSIIKMLPDKNINEIKKYNSTFYKQWYFKKIGNKAFSISTWRFRYYKKVDGKVIFISDEEGKSGNYDFKIYVDRSNFFGDIAGIYALGGLENTVNKALNIEYKKILDIGDGVKKKDVNNLHIKYCLEDCYFTYLLSKNINDMCIELDIPVNRYYSTASISKTFLRTKLKKPYKFLPNLVDEYALKNYNGGRFEVLKRGYFDKVYMADINSAYPYEMSKLYEPKGNLVYNKFYEPDSIYSFFKCRVKIDYDFIMSPFKYLIPKKDLLVFPIGEFREVILNKQEYELLREFDVKIDILDARHIFNKEPSLFIDFIPELYKKRLEFKKAGSRKEYIIKIILNSLYGITIQLNKLTELTHILDEVIENDKDVSTMSIKHEDKELLYFVLFSWFGGSFFNPIIANTITSNTRIKIFKDFHKVEDNVLMIATDSVACNKPLPVKDSKKLGGWEHYPLQKGFILGNGIYRFEDKDNNIQEKKRGLISDKPLDLYEFFNGNGNTLDRLFNFCYMDTKSLIKTRPKSLKEGLPFNYKTDFVNPNDAINIFLPYEKYVNVNVDKKRLWDRDFYNFVDVVTNQIDSKPLWIEDGRRI
jgi:hypothetical protein